MSLRTALLLSSTLIITACAAAPARQPTDHPNIRVHAPTANAPVSSPLTVTGEARGTWYFEASFPVKLLDAEGQIIASAPAQAQGEWMTEEFVPFSATLTFGARDQDATLVLEKDNPSGLPEHAAQVTIPVSLAP
ncbi:MAG: hypothetical protein G01um101425_445 [Candidatus Peregrinibacteria bacterium Gr01-1014_25]|nr:MAG: hypothetical protein G01um101425_445 [Candidatus Peregrinibacteria bacterium Gr01-1014_25]